ncbi:MAG: iron ABC transporter permease, partial [Desulfovibrionales bacterium]|nr:iron ABC transporter permease [Desulfovibrionales bacterium]
AGGTGAGLAYFQFKARHYNAMDLGDDTAQGMGIPPFRTRIGGMAMASLMTAVIISFVGIIGFVGLVAPHMLRRILGCDHGFLIPGSALAGALVLMGSDWAAQYILAPHVLPVSIFTAFIGAPIFMAMLEGSHGL